VVRDTSTIEQKKITKWLVITHYRVSTKSTLRGAIHFNNAPTIMSFTHLYTVIRQWERNENVLRPDFEVNG